MPKFAHPPGSPRLTKAGRPWGNKWHGSNAPVAQIRELYQAGLSTRQIAAKTGYSSTHVSKLCRGVARSRSAAAILRQPPWSTHWRSARARARKIVERALGYRLGPHFDVHHKDGDYTNHALENLEVLPHDEHARLHNQRRHRG